MSTVDFARKALALACVELPHLSGLAHQVELLVDDRVASAAVTPTGRVLLNEEWFGDLTLKEAAFVLAHELLHLALNHHQRLDFRKEGQLSNIAADAIINDMLEVELGMPPPCGGVQMAGARYKSSEQVLLSLRRQQTPANLPSWSLRAGHNIMEETSLQKSLREAGLAPQHPTLGGVVFQDLLSEELEQEWFPEDRRSRMERQDELQRAVLKVNSLGAFRECFLHSEWGLSTGYHQGHRTALETQYQPPWEMALQDWMQGAAPPQRSWARPSRRAGNRRDIVLPGRSRRGWTLNIVLDTSGSMIHQHSKLLGVIASYCAAQGVGDVRLLQCDTQVTVDHRVTPEELKRYEIKGMGGSDMSAAMNRLAEDAEVQAAVVITDGHISYPQRVPYLVLWALSPPQGNFKPRYGAVVPVEI